MMMNASLPHDIKTTITKKKLKPKTDEHKKSQTNKQTNKQSQIS